MSKSIVDHYCIDYPSRSRAYVAPLYLNDEITGAWMPNFDADIFARLTASFEVESENQTQPPSPIDILDYIYASLVASSAR